MDLSEALCILAGFCFLLAGTAAVMVMQRKKKNDPVTYSITTVLEEQK